MESLHGKGKTGDRTMGSKQQFGLGGCAVQDVYEFVIPWSEIGLAPRYSARIKVVAALADSLAYGDGEDKEMAPPAPLKWFFLTLRSG